MSKSGAQNVKQEQDPVEKMAEEVAVASGTKPNREVTLKNGREVEIYKCKTKNIGMILQLVSKVLHDLGVKDTSGTVAVDLNDPSVIMKTMASSSANVLEAMGELCSMPLEEINELEIDDTLKILIQIIEVNKDFFLRNVLPLVRSGLRANSQ